MTVFIAFLRAVNVGGASKLSMSTLKTLCEEAGFTSVRTYIASGNVVFRSSADEALVKALLKDRLHHHRGAPVGVLIREIAELDRIVADNPFSDAPGNSVAALLLDEPPPPETLTSLSGLADEWVALGTREVYVRYGAAGMGRSKLRIPCAESGTSRNMNTLSKLAEIASTL